MEPASGILVTPNVRLVRMVGVGGMGSVWVADHTGLATSVAVKFISDEVVRTRPILLERFKREAGIAARIKSPHVVQVFDHGVTEDGTPYIVMELLDGESLRARLKRERWLDPRHAAMLVAQAAQVLGRAHKLGVVHRDIKPANIFLASTEYELFVKILDFGIAKQGELDGDPSSTTSGLVMGSPLYMSPEQCLSAKDVDFRADLWSLSVVAYQALCGRPPFTGDTPGRVMRAEIERRDYQIPSKLRPALGDVFDRWFARAFARDIDERPQSADELARTFLGQASELAGGAISLLTSTTPSIEELAGSSMLDIEHSGVSSGGASSGSERSPAPVSRSAPDADRPGGATDGDADQGAGTEVDGGPPTLEDDSARLERSDALRPPAPASTTLPSEIWRSGRNRQLVMVIVVVCVIAGGLLLRRVVLQPEGPEGAAGGTSVATPPGGLEPTASPQPTADRAAGGSSGASGSDVPNGGARPEATAGSADPPGDGGLDEMGRDAAGATPPTSAPPSATSASSATATSRATASPATTATSAATSQPSAAPAASTATPPERDYGF